MIEKNLSKSFIINSLIVFSIFLLDRFSKIYVIYLDKNFLGSELFSSKFLFSKLEEPENEDTNENKKNENIVDDNKKNVRLEEDKPFPQFNLNVSNPISWKLIVLIMLMQLLTNIMLVVVLYLK